MGYDTFISLTSAPKATFSYISPKSWSCTFIKMQGHWESNMVNESHPTGATKTSM